MDNVKRQKMPPGLLNKHRETWSLTKRLLFRDTANLSDSKAEACRELSETGSRTAESVQAQQRGSTSRLPPGRESNLAAISPLLPAVTDPQTSEVLGRSKPATDDQRSSTVETNKESQMEYPTLDQTNQTEQGSRGGGEEHPGALGSTGFKSEGVSMPKEVAANSHSKSVVSREGTERDGDFQSWTWLPSLGQLIATDNRELSSGSAADNKAAPLQQVTNDKQQSAVLQASTAPTPQMPVEAPTGREDGHSGNQPDERNDGQLIEQPKDEVFSAQSSSKRLRGRRSLSHESLPSAACQDGDGNGRCFEAEDKLLKPPSSPLSRPHRSSSAASHMSMGRCRSAGSDWMRQDTLGLTRLPSLRRSSIAFLPKSDSVVIQTPIEKFSGCPASSTEFSLTEDSQPDGDGLITPDKEASSSSTQLGLPSAMGCAEVVRRAGSPLPIPSDVEAEYEAVTDEEVQAAASRGFYQ